MTLKTPTKIGILAGVIGLLGGVGAASWYWLHQIERIHRLYASSEVQLSLASLELIKSDQVPNATKLLETVISGRVIQLGKTYQTRDAEGPRERELLIRVKNYRAAHQVTTALSPQVNNAATEILNQAAK